MIISTCFEISQCSLASVAAHETCHGRFIALHTFTSLFPVTGLPNRIGIMAYRTSRKISTGLNKSAERALTPGFTALDIYRVAVGFLGKRSRLYGARSH